MRGDHESCRRSVPCTRERDNSASRVSSLPCTPAHPQQPQYLVGHGLRGSARRRARPAGTRGSLEEYRARARRPGPAPPEPRQPLRQPRPCYPRGRSYQRLDTKHGANAHNSRDRKRYARVERRPAQECVIGATRDSEGRAVWSSSFL